MVFLVADTKQLHPLLEMGLVLYLQAGGMRMERQQAFSWEFGVVPQ